MLVAVVSAAGLAIGDQPIGVDAQLSRWVDGTAATGLARALTTAGSLVVLVPIAAVVAGWLALRGRSSAAIRVAAATVGVVAIVNLVKAIVDRPRPNGPHLTAVASSSFPSQHAAQAAAIIPMLVLALLPAGRGRTAAVALSAAAAIAVGLSRISLGVHYPTDVIAGWFLGVAWLLVVLRTAPRADRRKPAPEGPST